MLKKKIISSLALTLVAASSIAQDLQFTQIMQSPNLLNPAAVGVYDGWERVALHHRSQWLGGNTMFTSSGLNVDATLNKDQFRPSAYVGVGLHFYNDIGGDARFGTQTGGLTISGVLPLGGGSQLSAGVQTAFGSKRGDMSRLVFDTQWAGSAYDPNYANQEDPALSTFRYASASAGVMYQYDGGQSTFARNNDTKIQFGLAAYHINQPEMKFRSGSSEKLYRKYVAMFNFTNDIPGSLWSMEAKAAQFIQGGHYETLAGLIMKRRFNEGSKQTGFKRDASIGFGCYTRIKDAIMPTIQVEYLGFKFGLSYDATLSAYRRSVGVGSLELSLSWMNQNHAIFKGRRNRY